MSTPTVETFMPIFGEFVSVLVPLRQPSIGRFGLRGQG